MTYYVDRKTLKTRKVKNLGWLLKHAGYNIIEAITINQHNGTYGVGANLTVRFADKIFYSDFASHQVCIDWVKARKSWRGVPVYYYLYNQFSSGEVL